jgi:hypothetical protein
MQKAINYPHKSRSQITKPLPCVIEAGCIENEQCFNIMFVRYDDQRSMEVVESSVIDFNKVIENLQQGNSVFIAPKRNTTRTPKTQAKKRHSEYFSHV